MFIDIITWKNQHAKLGDPKQKTLSKQTNFIQCYGLEEYIFDIIENKQIIHISKQSVCVPSGAHNTGNNKNEYLGVTPGKLKWRYCDATMNKLIKSGDIYKKGNSLYINKKIHGHMVTNLWDDIHIGRGKYPTQKPYKLMERIICLSTI